MIAEDYDRPRYVIVSECGHPAAELTRWLFEWHRIPYEDAAHVPFGRMSMRGPNGADAGPSVVTSASTWQGARETLVGLDGRLRDGERLFGESADERTVNQQGVDRLLEKLLVPVRRLQAAHLLPIKPIWYPIITHGAPAWERMLLSMGYPLWSRRLARAIDVSAKAVDSARASVFETCQWVEATLAARGTPFLGGERPAILDVVFSALIAPLVLPERDGTASLPLARVPAAFRDLVDLLRARRAGQLALATYQVARPSPQPPLQRPRRDRTVFQLLVGPTVFRLGARLAVRFSRPILFRKLALVTRWPDVQDVLQLDLHYHVAPVNGPPFAAISGAFVLGLDRGDQFARERRQMYCAMARVDAGELRARIARDATRLLDIAVSRDGRIDVAHGYAHLVAARTARYLFGIAGPTEADLIRVSRALFHYSFLNQNNDPAVAERARRAGLELRAWVNDEIARRRRDGVEIDDVLGRLMAEGTRDGVPIDDDAVRRNLTGLLAGAIDTTSPTVPRIVYMLASNPTALAMAERDVNDRERMTGWCWEALRMWPTAGLLFRRTPAPTTIGGRVIKPDTLVAAFTQAAMYDPAVFPHPMTLDPMRPRSRYINFGGGLHPCAGRGVNDVQLPELVAQLVARGIAGVGHPRFVGPFIDELVVTFRRPQS